MNQPNKAPPAQQDFLNVLFENLSDGVVACDSEGRIILFNKRLRQWHGVPPSESLPHDQWATSYHLYQADGKTLLKQNEIPLWRAFQGEKVTDFKMVVAVPGKAPLTFLASGEAIYDNLGNKMGAVIVMHNITEQDQFLQEINRLNQELAEKVQLSSKQLSENMAELQMKSEALEKSLNAFDIVNSKGEFIYANEAYLKMWGYEKLEEILSTSPAGHCADPQTALKIITTLKEKGECNLEFLARRKDGSTFEVHMWARLAYDLQGEEIYPTTAIDITDRKIYERKLVDAIQSRDSFLSIASHELKTPLTSLKLQNQIRRRKLAKGEMINPEKLDQQFESDGKQFERLSRLIDDMLDITRITSGKLLIHPEKVNLCQLARQIVAELNQQSAENHQLIHLNCLSEVWGHWDSFRLEQVLVNLLSNGLKYGAGKPMEVRVWQDEQFAKLVVKDQGMGIPPEDQQRIFQRFERVTPAGKISGLGLGLYIVREIVDKHGGNISLESTLGQGSTFTVNLPLT